MTVFKNYYKIVKAHIFSFLVYIGIFMVILLGFLSSNNNDNSLYQKQRPSIYLENTSKSQKAGALENYLNENCKVIKDLPKDELEDHLFYQDIVAIVNIGDEFDKEGKVEIKTIKGTYASYQTKELINSYLQGLASYEKAGFSESKAEKFAGEDRQKEVKVSMLNREKGSDEEIASAFNFLAYILVVQILLTIGQVNMVYKEKTILKREEISPFNRKARDFQLNLGHIISACLIRLLYILIFYSRVGDKLNSKGGKLMMLNSLIFAISVVCLGALLSKLVTSSESLAGFVNTIALASSFLSGVFVPQEILSKGVLKIARAFPTYYYVEANQKLLANASFSAIARDVYFMGGFCLIFLILSGLIKNREKVKEE